MHARVTVDQNVLSLVVSELAAFQHWRVDFASEQLQLGGCDLMLPCMVLVVNPSVLPFDCRTPSCKYHDTVEWVHCACNAGACLVNRPTAGPSEPPSRLAAENPSPHAWGAALARGHHVISTSNWTTLKGVAARAGWRPPQCAPLAGLAGPSSSGEDHKRAGKRLSSAAGTALVGHRRRRPGSAARLPSRLPASGSSGAPAARPATSSARTPCSRPGLPRPARQQQPQGQASPAAPAAAVTAGAALPHGPLW